ncbi:MAG: S9 family peptidase [Draconibacterium sp.]|nr:MAG: S9 family peptidase [Draconibacterium sp.]
MRFLLFLLLIITLSDLSAQIEKNNKSSLTIEQIMQDPEKWIGMSPQNLFWSADSKIIYFDWNPDGDTLSSLYGFKLSNGKTFKVTDKEKVKLPGHDAVFNRNRSSQVFTRNGNIYLQDVKTGKVKQLTNWLKRAYSPAFVLGDTQISFMMDNNLYTINPKTGFIRQITNFSSGKEQAESAVTEQDKWLENQQNTLFSVLKEREAIRKAQENREKATAIRVPEKIYLGKKYLNNITLSPTGKFLIYNTYERPEGAKATSVTHFVTESGYTEEHKARPKVGIKRAVAEMGILNVDSNCTITIRTEDIPGLKALPAYLSDYPQRLPKDSSEIKCREVSLLGPVWNPDKDVALVVALSPDNKDRWILLLDPATGKLKTLDYQHDDAWIGGPGIGGWGYSQGSIGWMPDNKSVWFQSEESGYSHLYTVNITTGIKKALTSGNFEISGAFISADKKNFYFTANKNNPGVKQFYRMPVAGGELIQITSMEGNNKVTLSPDEKKLAIRFSYANQPWELYIQKNSPGIKALQVTHSTSTEFESYPWRVPEFVSFKAEDGTTIHARLYRPEKPEKQGPAVIFVHGAGYLQNAHRWWSSYEREYQFHNYLADNGYTVLDIDYRGSAGYGRDCRTGIYRHMGGKDLSDQIDGVKMLINKYDVSPKRIGIYGGSYGGFITLMAMFNHPKVFAAGAALRSVTDFAHYNHGYTSNILNTPVEDSIAFVQSSPIYFAEGLQGALLMCHGMVDDNVQFQDIVRLTQRLIELGKENWELAVYPVESHGFIEPSSWTDEYKRIFKIFEENLK